MTTIKPFPPIDFLISAARPEQFPADTGNEVAFVGRSNSGKSSAINTITGQKKLAKTSKTPGRTQLINFFTMTEQQRLIDLPGYGYAKVAMSTKEKWNRLLDDYLTQRHALRGVFLIMDIRHPWQPLDQQMLYWLQQQNLPAHILLTKADKLTRNNANKTLHTLQNTITQAHLNCTIQTFSSHNQLGLEQARQQLLNWLALE